MNARDYFDSHPTPEPTPADIDADMLARGAKATALMDADPGLSYISAIIIAGDMLAAERSKRWVEDGMDAWPDAATFVGSYGRLDFCLWAVENGHMDRATLLDQLPGLWSGSDPRDDDGRFAALWTEAWVRNGRRTIRDGGHLPKGKLLRVYRGQMPTDPFGIAWTLDPAVADKFAHGAGTREHHRAGTRFDMLVPRSAIVAYLTGRGESECIIPALCGVMPT